MVADGLLTRQRYREVPPRVEYELTERARDLEHVIGSLTRWGREWAWTAPREGEQVSIPAILRSASGLGPVAGRTSGTVEVVIDDEPRHQTCALEIADGRIAFHERAPENPDSSLEGTESDWVAALGPVPDTRALRITGDAALAGAVFDTLAGRSPELCVAEVGA